MDSLWGWHSCFGRGATAGGADRPWESAAVGLHALAGEIRSTLDELEQEASSKPTAILAVRIADWTEVYRRALEDWFAFYEGYHPAFSWWTQAPQEQVIQELKTFASEVRKQFAGYQEGEDPPVIGDPIGRQALMEALEYENGGLYA